MRIIGITFILAIAAGCNWNVNDHDDSSDDSNVPPADTDVEPQGYVCEDGNRVDAYMGQEYLTEVWQVGADAQACWKNDVQVNGDLSWACIEPGVYARQDVASVLNDAAAEALDCACKYAMNGTSGPCDVNVATGLTACGAPEGAIIVNYGNDGDPVICRFY